MKQRSWAKRGVALLAAMSGWALVACGGSGGDAWTPPGVAQPESPQPPVNTLPIQLEGPVTGGLGMISVSSTMFPLTALGYTGNEYFVSGTAASYAASGPLDESGYWNLSKTAERAQYKTRIVVYRPKESAKFNGTVIVEWLNVSGGTDAAPGWINAHNEFLRQGYAWVGVSVQKEGIDGGGAISILNLPLKTFDRARYGSLQHPGNRFSYDIYSQVARILRQPQAVNPLAGLNVKRLVASGESQSAMHMVSYVNGIAPLEPKLFDGYFIHSRTFGSAPLDEDGLSTSSDMTQVMRVRTDVAPVMTVQTESDLFGLNFYPSRQPDSTNFRLWEIAGTSHADLYTMMNGLFDVMGLTTAPAQVVENKQPIPGIINCEQPVNSGPQHFVISAAYAALNRWITTGAAPNSAPRLTVNASGTDYQRDIHGNVLGGIRTPYVDVPVATLRGDGQPGSMTGMANDPRSFCFLFGTTHLFDAAKLQTLYPTHQAYVDAVSASADAAAAQGFLLASDVALIKKTAQLSKLGN